MRLFAFCYCKADSADDGPLLQGFDGIGPLLPVHFFTANDMSIHMSVGIITCIHVCIIVSSGATCTAVRAQACYLFTISLLVRKPGCTHFLVCPLKKTGSRVLSAWIHVRVNTGLTEYRMRCCVRERNGGLGSVADFSKIKHLRCSGTSIG